MKKTYSTQLSMTFSPLINVTEPTIVGILKLIYEQENSILGLSGPEKNPEFLDVFIVMSI